MKCIRFLAVVVLIFAIVFFGRRFLFKKTGIDDKLNLSAGSDPGSVTEQIQMFSLQGFSESGKKLWQIEGKTADIFSDVIDLKEISADSLNEGITVELKADKGIFDKKSNNMVLKENVNVTTSDKSVLTTNSLKWDAKEELITTDDSVYIEREDMDAEGVGASAKPNLKKAQLDESIKVTIKKPPAVITCDGPLEIDYKSNIASFYKNVRLDDKKVQIDTDKATAYFDPEKHILTKVLCEGNVKIVRGEDTTTAEKLTYFTDESRVVLDGRPQVVISSTDELLKEAQ